MFNAKKENYLKRLNIVFRYLKPHRRQLFIILGISLVSAGANAAVPYIGGRLFDAILGRVSSAIILFLGLWILSRGIHDIADKFKDVRRETLAVTLESNYLIDGFSKLLLFPLSFHKKHKIGEITKRIDRASDWLSSIVNRILIDSFPDFLSIIIAIFITFSIKPVLAVMLIFSVFIYILVLIKIAPRIADLLKKMHRSWSVAYGDAYDSVLNVQAIKQATTEKYEKRKFFKNFRLKAARFFINFVALQSSLNLTQRLLITFTNFALLIFSIFLIWKNELTIGELLAFQGYAAMFFAPFITLGRNWSLIQNGLVAIERAEEILQKPEEIYVPKNAVILAELNGKIEFQNVSFGYSKNQNKVLDDVSFAVNSGQTVALVGESGVGKTTLIDLISFYFQPNHGRILIDGHNIKNLDLRVLRAFISIVPQEIMLFNDTVKNNIKYGKFDANDADVMEAARLAHADEFIENFPKKYNQLVGERGIKLSTGQKQRIAIARAILRNPRILILDEPTSALDAKSEEFIGESLEKLMKNRTTFIIAHRFSTVRKADLILVLDKGRIVEKGRHEELMKIEGGVYKKLYELQIGFR
ncbi:MAG: ABC transporter ATP-binding protein [Candidatus Brennerbacteria bacterium]|nr:ABC transporter ATP-binding protein [Candidatus Brennerbacteria bacterium]